MQNGGDGLYFLVKWLKLLGKATRVRTHRMAWDLLVLYSRALYKPVELSRETLDPVNPGSRGLHLAESSREVRRAALAGLEKLGGVAVDRRAGGQARGRPGLGLPPPGGRGSA